MYWFSFLEKLNNINSDIQHGFKHIKIITDIK